MKHIQVVVAIVIHKIEELMPGSIKLKWLLLIFVALVLSNQQYSYAEPIGLGFKICGDDCMLVKPPVEHPQLKDIFFENEAYSLNDANRKSLKKMAEVLKNNPSWLIEIQGHADILEKDSLYAIAVGERRSHSTKMYLVSQGVSAKRIHAIAYGKERPFCFDPGKECRQKNNRVHFKLMR